MAQYQLLRCVVALGGDDDTTVYLDRTKPILFPELIVLQFLHGENAVTDVHVVGTCEMATEEAMQRLVTIYGGEVVKTVFPGARPQLPRADGSIPICTRPVYVPRVTMPDSPDPKLRPLGPFAMAGVETRLAPELPDEDEPTDAEIAASAQEDEPADMSLVDALADDLGLGVASKPNAAVLTQGRPAVAGNRSGSRRGPQREPLPDVASPTHRAERPDEAARG